MARGAHQASRNTNSAQHDYILQLLTYINSMGYCSSAQIRFKYGRYAPCYHMSRIRRGKFRNSERSICTQGQVVRNGASFRIVQHSLCPWGRFLKTVRRRKILVSKLFLYMKRMGKSMTSKRSSRSCTCRMGRFWTDGRLNLNSLSNWNASRWDANR
jgi:hypothetical protein